MASTPDSKPQRRAVTTTTTPVKMTSPTSPSYSAFSFSTPSPRLQKQKNRRSQQQQQEQLSFDFDSSAASSSPSRQSSPSPSMTTKPPTPSTNPPPPTRQLFLIRHGESLGQIANRQQRKTDFDRLTDCGLSRTGCHQAEMIPSYFPKRIRQQGIQLIVTSPLTRAIQTTLLAWPSRNEDGDGDNNNNNHEIPILVAYDLREIGSPIPENQPRKLKDVWRDLGVSNEELERRFDLTTFQYDNNSSSPRRTKNGANQAPMFNPGIPDATSSDENVDKESMEIDDQNNSNNQHGPATTANRNNNDPPQWWSWPPPRNDNVPKVVRRDRIRKVFGYLAEHLPPHITTLAVVCHFHVIRNALTDPYQAPPSSSSAGSHTRNNGGANLSPINGQPIECLLHPNGAVEFVRELGLNDDDEDGEYMEF